MSWKLNGEQRVERGDEHITASVPVGDKDDNSGDTSDVSSTDSDDSWDNENLKMLMFEVNNNNLMFHAIII